MYCRRCSVDVTVEPIPLDDFDPQQLLDDDTHTHRTRTALADAMRDARERARDQ